MSRARGVAAVEFALLLPVLLALAFGASELGRAIYTYNTLDKAVRDGVRHLSQHGPGDATIISEAKCLAVFGNLTCSGTPLAPGLTTTAVTVCDASPLSCPTTHSAQPTGLGVRNLVTLSITGYVFNSAVTYVIPNLNFNNISATMAAQL
jgi:Flp pilus assembly protein TadG